jgi:two-component system nitrogen regulation response regulator GlnG
MSAVARRSESIPSVLSFFREGAADRVATAGCQATALGLMPHRASAPAHLLLLDEEPDGVARQLRRAFPAPEYRVQVTSSGHGVLRALHGEAPDVVVLRLGRRVPSGLEAYQRIRQLDARVPVICVAAATQADAAIEAMKHGAYDFLFEPVELPVLQRAVGEALDVARRLRGPTVAGATETEDAEGALVGACPAMREVYKAIGRVAAQDVPVLITGASGTGKELVARALYQHSRRADGPFLAINCAAIPETLLESELFGHEKGAFTGADRKRIGKFEQVSGGTLFLDEVGDMPLALQAKILRLLQEQAFERVGGNETVRSDVRVIAATHHDLRADSAEGTFRADLYYRLGVFTVHLPPLRERGDDLPLLVRHYLRRFSKELGREVQEVAREALERLCAYSWPGNIRELQSVLKQALLRASGPVLLPAFLPDLSGKPVEGGPAALGAAGLEALIRARLGPEVQDLYAQAHREVDRILLPVALEYTGGNQHQAARLLGIARQTLRAKLRDLGVYVTRSVEAEQDDAS